MIENRQKPGLLSELILSRSNFVELVIVGVLLGLSINLLAGSIPAFLGYQPTTTFYLSLGATVLLLAYLSVRFFGHRTKSSCYSGFFSYSRKQNSVVETQRYAFSRRLTRSLASAFAENSAMKTLWNKEPLSSLFAADKKESAKGKQTLEASKLIVEAVEYFILDRLSTHLVDYFNDPQFKKGRVKELSREDIPTILLQNRFLELFSKPMRDRPQFVKDHSEHGSHGEIVMAYGEGGALYSKFDLVFPIGTKLSRVSSQTIRIETKRFDLTISIHFTGVNTYIPFEFHKYVQMLSDLDDILDFKVVVDFRIEFKFGSLFRPSGWEYFHWLDSFLQSFDGDFSEETFFNRIGWEQALTTIDFVAQQRSTQRTSLN